MADPPALVCRDLTVAYGDVPVLRDLELSVAAGETVAVLGPSGSGKTTLLYAVAGFVTPTAGIIELGGEVVQSDRHRVPAERRQLGLVFQHAALWPHLDALATVAYPLRRRGVTRARAESRARELLGVMGIAELAHRTPDRLSGGQQQRVGLARALARDARLYLLDEPTAHLDAPLRTALQLEIAAIRGRTGAAALYATHDAGEALAVADRVALLRDGGIVQIGTPADVYARPIDLWAARLTGPASILDVEVVGDDGTSATDGGRGPGGLRVRVGDTVLDVPLPDGAQVDVGAARLLVRPDWIRLHVEGPTAEVRHVAFRGPYTDHVLATEAGEIVARATGPPRLAAGTRVSWGIREAWVLPV